jgi:polysaccharide transporter, PST family
VSGVLWTAGLNVFRDFVQFGVMLVLVRLLAPEMYGQFGLVSAILGFLSVFSYRTFLEYSLQIRQGSEVDYQLFYTAGVVTQGLLFLITNAAAEGLKYTTAYREVAAPVHVMSLVFLLDLGHEFRIKMLEREMDWKRLRMMEGIGVLSSAVLAVILAKAGAGVYALLVPTLVTLIPASVDLFFIQRWRPTWKWNAAEFRPVRKYGLTRLMSGLVGWGRLLLESTFLVRIAGFTVYGIYGRAVGLATLCCLRIPTLLMQALFPVLTKFEPGSGPSNRASTLVLCTVAWSTIPVAVLFSLLAAPVIQTLYGSRWSAVIPLLPWALAAGAAAALAQTGSLLLLASLQQKRSMWIDTFMLAGTAVSLLVLAPRSLKLYLAGSAVLQTSAFVLAAVWLYCFRAIDLRGLANSLIPPALSVTTTFVGLELLRGLLAIPLNTLGEAVVYGAVFCVLYALQLRVLCAQQCREVVRYLPGRSYLQRWLVLGT